MDRVFINKQFLLSKQAANSEIDDVNICCVQCQESEEVLDYVFAGRESYEGPNLIFASLQNG